jgi:hypothetical protein
MILLRQIIHYTLQPISRRRISAADGTAPAITTCGREQA